MGRVLRFGEHAMGQDLARELVEGAKGPHVLESDGDRGFVEKLFSDLRLNAGVILSFGTGLEIMLPVMRRLVQNGELRVDASVENVALLTLTAITIAYLQEEREERARRALERDSKSLLEELKLRGIGNGIVRKAVGCVRALGALAKILLRHRGHVLASLLEMLGYSALCLPVIGSVKALIGAHGLTLDNFANNMASVAVGLGALSLKNGLEYLRGLASRAKGPGDDGDEDGQDLIVEQ